VNQVVMAKRKTKIPGAKWIGPKVWLMVEVDQSKDPVEGDEELFGVTG